MSQPFALRHIGPGPSEVRAMLEAVGVPSMEALIDQSVPPDIRIYAPLDLPPALDEHAYLARMTEAAEKNRIFRSFIGQGYHDCITPPAILRNVLENPSWYTPYTPYQAEIAQGRLEGLFNFQTMMADLAGLAAANASLLDEATAAAEAMTMLHRIHQRRNRKAAANVFFVSDAVYPQTLAVLQNRAEPLGITLEVGQFRSVTLDQRHFGALVQFPDAHGMVDDLRSFIAHVHAAGALVAVAADPLSLAIFTPPGEMGADVVLGSTQRLGIPMGFGGPHAAYFATRDEFTREMPGRIIGLSVDQKGRPAYRLALQTREQHIRREKAKSNICTAQALLANITGFYGIYHGPEGLRRIALAIHRHARQLEAGLRALGYRQTNPYYFDTLRIPLGAGAPHLRGLMEARRINLGYPDGHHAIIALNETTTDADIEEILDGFAAATGRTRWPVVSLEAAASPEPMLHHEDLVRKTSFMTAPVFTAYRSETALMRYIKGLELKDLALNDAMIPLGSCTMKLNSAAEMMPVTWPGFGRIHPFAPHDQTPGYAEIITELEAALATITGFAAVSLQPNAGAQGEYAGLMVIRAYHRDRGETQRTVALIPASAHGTNPASAVMAGMDVIVVACDEHGYVDVTDLITKAEKHKERLAALMVTYPSTYGVFEDRIREICQIVHDRGGLVYMDGANMNAQVGLTNPAIIGADVCHLNLHKTFSIPHGGGGPGMGPIGVTAALAPYLPGHPLVKTGGGKAIPAVSAAPWGSASVLLISYGYIKLLGPDGLVAATRQAILSANYVKARLAPHYEVHFTNHQGRVAHELIFDLRPLKEKAGIDEQDVAKRLMDYGFHAPTVSWPVPGTMMIEPTESEPKEELDRFCDAMIAIRAEIEDIIQGKADPENNVLRNAPHPAVDVCTDHWPHPYSREQAAYPAPWLRQRKFWPAIGRIDNPYGDRHLVCTCAPVAAYAD